MLRKLKRDELPDGKVLCDYCVAKCCRYFAVSIDTPESVDDFQLVRWFLMHQFAAAFVEDNDWYLLVQTPCKHLRADNRCGTYDTRPKICREYTTDQCEYDDHYVYDRYFETSEQVQEYCDAMFSEPGQENFRSPRPPLLPIL
jgi:Fe-S-cluster containining protein